MGYPHFMSGSILDIPKKRGRPSTGGRQEGVLVRLPAEQLARLDAWREPSGLSRPEAIRRLVEAGLKT
ncbi:ribbon-helix-helix domain-containing protein [Sphingomonas sp. HMP6]|uniref:ribbon-helix-helix domain-containing protein n=1 Tax=Sphingomonas sp. HMP6 TaxID=1517551 RepID=UPI0018D779A9